LKKDPYDQLAGLDQRLFQETKTDAPPQRDNATTPQRSPEGAQPGGDHGPAQGAPQATTSPSVGATAPTSPEPSRDATATSASAAPSEATRTPVSVSSGQVSVVRAQTRHSHDIFHDQVRWMNRLKFQIEEERGLHISSNNIVRLAIDLIRADYEANGEESHLVRILVKGRPWRVLDPKPDKEDE